MYLYFMILDLFIMLCVQCVLGELTLIFSYNPIFLCWFISYVKYIVFLGKVDLYNTIVNNRPVGLKNLCGCFRDLLGPGTY